MLKGIFTRDVVERAVKTFVQAALASLVVSVASVHDVQTAKIAAVAALSAGISAVWNIVR